MNTIKKSFLAGVFVLLLIANFNSCRAKAEMKNIGGAMLDLNEAIEKSKEELNKRGYIVEDMRVQADQNNTVWKEFVAGNPLVLQNEIVKRMKIEEKTYWVIYYGPKKLIPGGDVWVFVDANNGEIIGVILGK